jgi:hypothetical protein
MDIIKDSTHRLGFELDVFWIQRGGENPVTLYPAVCRAH